MTHWLNLLFRDIMVPLCLLLVVNPYFCLDLLAVQNLLPTNYTVNVTFTFLCSQK